MVLPLMALDAWPPGSPRRPRPLIGMCERIAVWATSSLRGHRRGRLLSRRVANNEPELAALIGDVTALGEVTWAVDLPGGATAWPGTKDSRG